MRMLVVHVDLGSSQGNRQVLQNGREEAFFLLFLKDHKTYCYSVGRGEGRGSLCQSCRGEKMAFSRNKISF